MLAKSVFVATFAPALANYGDADKAKDVKQFHIQCYAAADCTGDAMKHDFKEVGACMEDEDNGKLNGNFKMGLVTDTAWVQKMYIDATCTTQKGSETTSVPKACTKVEEDGNAMYCKGAVDAAVCSLFRRQFTKAGCSMDDMKGHTYHGADVCEMDNGKSYKRECTSDGGFVAKGYASTDCSGATTASTPRVGGGTCTAVPDDDISKDDKGLYYQIWTWKEGGVSNGIAPSANGSKGASGVALSLTLLGVLVAAIRS